ASRRVHAQVVAGADHAVAHGEARVAAVGDLAGDVDAGRVRVGLGHAAVAAGGESGLVVQRGALHPHDDVVVGQDLDGALLDAPPDTALVDVHAERPESARDALSHALILVRRMRRLVPMNQSRTMTIATVAVVVLILAAAIVIPRLGGSEQPAAATIDYSGQPIVGRDDAPVKMLVFFDFLCPHCATFSETVTSVLKREYVANGDLAIHFANFPVIAPQGMSRTLAILGECVNRQGRDGFGVLEPVLLRAQSTLTTVARAIDLAEE